jgi:hypothetical protein
MTRGTAKRARRGPLRHHRLQGLLAILAVGTAVALPVLLVAVGGGVYAHEIVSLQDAGYQIVVSAGGEHGIASAHRLASEIDSLGSVQSASPILSAPVDVFVNGRGATPALAEGVVPAAFEATEGPAARSLFPSPLPLGDPTDLVHFANGTYDGPATYDLLVSSPFAAAYGVGIGTSVGLAASADASHAIAFRVTGIFGVPPTALGPTAAFALLVPLSDLQSLVGVGRAGTGGVADGADTIQVALGPTAATSPSAISAIASSIQRLVPYYGVSELLEEANSLRHADAVLEGFYVALSSVSLAVGVLFLGVVLVRRVESERASIAVTRAVGVPARQIAARFARDGAGLAAAGAAIGVPFAFLLVAGLAWLGSPTVAETARLAEFVPTTIGALVLGVVGLGALASLGATRSALRLSIPEALR